MKKAIVLIAGFVYLAALMVSSAAAHPSQESALVRKCLQYERTLTTPSDFPVAQRTLLAVTLAAADVPTSDPAEYLQAYEQAGILVFYRKTSDTSFTWSEPDWVGSTRTSYSYASGSNLSEEISQSWSGTQWDNVSRIIYIYDGSGRLSTMTFQTWQTSAWTNDSRTTYTYDGSGHPIELLTEHWQSSAWVNFSKTTMTYSSGRLATSTSQSWVSSAWVNSTMTTFTYDGGGHLTETLMQNWQSSSWVNNLRFTNTWVGNNETQLLTQNWSGSDWIDMYKFDNSYDGDGNEILSVRSMSVAMSWIETDADTSKYSGGNLVENVDYSILSNFLESTQYNYDVSGNLIEDITRTAIPGNSWTNVSRDVYVYESYLDVADQAVAGRPAQFEFQNYPNPFNAGTVISFSLARDAHVRVVISNLLGQTVATLVDANQTLGLHRVVWNGANDHGEQVASGIYLSRVQIGNATQVRKMVLLR